MTDPFDDPDALYRVVTDSEHRYSLWPDFALVPPGWWVAFGPADVHSCLCYVESEWVRTEGKQFCVPSEYDDISNKEAS